jgi:hypothetical protein
MSRRGVLRGSVLASLGGGSKKFDGFLELVLTGNASAGVGGKALLSPFAPAGTSDVRPESTRATTRSSLTAGDAVGESSTPILSCAVRLGCPKASSEGGCTL